MLGERALRDVKALCEIARNERGVVVLALGRGVRTSLEVARENTELLKNVLSRVCVCMCVCACVLVCMCVLCFLVLSHLLCCVFSCALGY